MREGSFARFVSGAAVLAGLLCAPGLLAAQGNGPRGMSAGQQAAVDKERQSVESQARRTVRSLFDRLCPGRCELVDLSAQMKSPQTVAGVEPGFGGGGAGGQVFDVEPKSVDVTVLVDSKLPGNFKQNLPRMIEYQLGDLAPEVNVRRESLDFPEPQNRPSPPEQSEEQNRRRRPPRRRPKMRPKAEPESDEQKDEEQSAEDEEDEKAADAEKKDEPRLGFWGRFFEDVTPWIGPILLVIAMFLLARPLIRQFGALGDRRRPEPSGAGAGGTGDGSGVDVEALRGQLTESRAVKNRVLRRWVEEDPGAVADLVRLLGPTILEDLKADDTLRAELSEVSEMVAERREPLSEDESKQVVREARARIRAAKLTHDGQALDADWNFLEGISVATLQRIMRSCDTREKVHVVGQLPDSLRSSYLESLGADQRKELFLAAGSQELGKQESRALASRLRQTADEYGHIGAEAEGQAALVVDMLESLDLDEQEETLRDLENTRTEVAEAAMSRVCLMSTILHVPEALVAEALHRMPVDQLADVLRESNEKIRRRVIEVAPRQKAEDLQTELALEAPVARSEYLAARSRFTEALQTAMRREGEDLVEANRRAIRGGDQTTTRQNEGRS
jgi:hypothetical protein